MAFQYSCTSVRVAWALGVLLAFQPASHATARMGCDANGAVPLSGSHTPCSRPPLHTPPPPLPPPPQLRKAVDALLSQPGAVRPEKARFFRGQMQTIITKALGECGIKALPSRRCFSIMCEWHAAAPAPQGCHPNHRAHLLH